MKSSGISFKKGLAATAIGALAITGTPFLASSASATPLATQAASADNAYLLTGDVATGLSAKNDGTNNTISLAANGGSNVTSIQFQYVVAGSAPVAIGAPVARNADGLFVTEWDGNAGPGVTNVTINAVPNTGVANLDSDTFILLTNAAANTVELSTEGARGVFQSPYTADNGSQYVAVNGTASNGSAVTVGADFTGAPGATAATVVTPAGAATSTFSGIIDIKGYTYSPAADANQLAIGAVTQNTDDHEASTLYVQTPTKVTAVANNTNQPNGNPATVTVTVLDQNNNPIANALVNYTTPNATPGGAPVASGVPNQRTGADGTTTFSVGAPGTYTFSYDTAAGATAANMVFTAGPSSAPVVITSYTPSNTSLVASSVKGYSNFDNDELTSTPNDDFIATLKDQNGNPVNGQTIEYSYTFAPADGSAATSTAYVAAPFATGTNGAADGTVVIPSPNAAQSTAGSYTLNVRRAAQNGVGFLQGTPAAFKAAESEITFADGSSTISPINGTDTYKGTLALTGVTGNLGGRTVDVTLTRSAGGDASFSTTQPAGTTYVSPTSVTAVTAADGSFTVSVTDPTVPGNVTPTPESDTITATATGLNAGDTTPGPADARGSIVANFSSVTPPAGSTVTVTPFTGTQTPGTAVSGSAVVKNAAGTVLANQVVTLTIDKGFFTDGTLDPAPAAGADAGELKSLGTSFTTTTDANGVANFKIDVERDAALDDDGMDNVTVTATAGSATGSAAAKYSSDNPLNGGTVTIVKSPAAVQSGPTDPAATGQVVAFDVFTKDQFGNVVGNQAVTLTENGNQAQLGGGVVVPGQGYQANSDFANDGDFTLTSSAPDTVTVNGVWTTGSYRYTTATGTGNPQFGTENVTGTAMQTFANAGGNVTTSTATLSHSPASPAVGTTVTETLTVVDTQGQPISGATVNFSQSGPNSESGNVTTTTNAAGQAFYSFQGNSAGAATITAVITGNGTKTVTDSVTFAAKEDGGRDRVVARLSAPNNGPKDDTLKVTTKPIAANSTVRFYKVIGKKQIFLDAVKIGRNGFARYTADDKNGRRFTKYFATVGRTATTQAARTNSKRTR